MSKPLRAIAIALLLGTATAAAATFSTTGMAYAAGARAAVGKPLQEAIDLAKNGNGSAALAKVKQAEAVGGLTSEEQRLIAQTKEYITVKTGVGNANSSVGARAKFAADYNAGRYRQVISEDADLLRKYGALDGQSQVIIGQCYYLMGDYSGAIRYLRGLGDSEQVLSIIINAAAKTGDSDTERAAATKLILKGQSKYWPFLLGAADRTHGLNDHETLDIYRVRYGVGQMRNADDYLLLSQIALQFGYAAEGLKVAQDGFDKKVLSGDRAQRLINLAKNQAAQDAAKLNAEIAAAKKGNGDGMVKLGEDLMGNGRNADAVALVQAGIAKGVTDADDAQLSLGIVLSAAGQKDAAARAFGSVKRPGAKAVADLWSVYSRTR